MDMEWCWRNNGYLADFASIDESYASADDVIMEENNTVMPENMSICKFVDVENTYLFDGEIIANGKVTTSVLIILNRELRRIY